MTLSRELAPLDRLGFSGFCSITWYSRPSMVKATVLKRFLLVRPIGFRFPFTSTAYIHVHDRQINSQC